MSGLLTAQDLLAVPPARGSISMSNGVFSVERERDDGDPAGFVLVEQSTRGADARCCRTIGRRRQLQGAIHVAANFSRSLQNRYLRFVF